MTEYDFSPEGSDRYMTTQNRTTQWADSARQYSRLDPFGMPNSERGTGYSEGNISYDGHRHDLGGPPLQRRGRPRQLHTDYFPPQGSSSTPYRNMPPVPAPQVYDLDPSSSRLPSVHGSSRPLENQQYSMGRAPSFHSVHPEEHYPPMSQNSLLQRAPSHSGSINYTPLPHSMLRYPSSRTPLPMSVSGYESQYSSRSSSPACSDYSYSSRSYSTDSYDSYRRPSHSRTSRMYRTVHPTVNAPTIIQPDRTRPIVVPINGGVGGYVVVPAVGQTLRVVDPQRLQQGRENRSLLGRILSPTTWGMGTRKRRRSRRY